MSDVSAEGGRPVTYTCMALPNALKLGAGAEASVAEAPVAVAEPMTSPVHMSVTRAGAVQCLLNGVLIMLPTFLAR